MSIVFSSYCLYRVLKNFSKKIIIFDVVILIACFQWLIAPIITYNFFNKSNELAYLWKTYMILDKTSYLQYAFFATFFFAIGLRVPLRKYKHSDLWYVDRAKQYLSDKGNLSILFMVTGFTFTVLNPFLPQILQGIFFFASQLTFIGVFYGIFSEFRHKKILIFVAFSLLIVQTMLTAMFGELVFWSLLFILTISVGKNYGIILKSLSLVFGVVAIMFLQTLKIEYRYQKISNDGSRNFLTAIVTGINKTSVLVDENVFYPIIVRINQGYFIAESMRYVPQKEPYANGETIFTQLAASFIPRIFWPSKPEMGGRENIVRFLGADDDLKYSYNISPAGEAYVNFGKIGGVIFMLFFGLFMNYSFTKVLEASIRRPSLVVWIPLFFYGVFLSIEGDILSAVNGMIKSILFFIILASSMQMLFKSRI